MPRKGLYTFFDSATMINREQFTKDILNNILVFAVVTNLILWVGTFVGLVAVSDSFSSFLMVVVVVPFWYAVKKGGWGWVRFFPSVYCFGIGVYAILRDYPEVSSLFFIIAIVLSGMLVSSKYQLLVLVLSSVCTIFLSWIKYPVPDPHRTLVVTFSIFIFVAITIITRYYNIQLHKVLQSQAEAYESLYTEMEHSKATNETLAEKEKQLRRLTENTSDLVGEIKTDGTFLYTSPSYYTSLGYPDGSLVGENAFKFIHPEDLENVISAINRTVTTRVGEKTRLRYKCADGTFKRFETAGTPLFNSEKQIEGFVISSRDITQQVEAEEQREKSEKREQNIINSIPLGMHMYDLLPDGSLIFSGYNPAADYILRFDHSSIIGKPIEEAFPSLVDTEIPAKYREAARNGTPYYVDPINYHDLNVGGAYEVHAFQVSPMKMVTVFSDISEKRANAIALKSSEEKFSKAFYTSPDSININRLVDGVYIDTNQGFTNITGWEREEVIGRSSLDINIWADPEDRKELVRGLLADGYYNNLEARFRYKDGSVRTGIMSARVIELNNEKCILSITRDISDRIEVQERLNAAHEQLALAYGETLEGWVHALDLREHETAGHSRRVVELTKKMLETVDYTEEEKTNIYRGALLHDIGKMGVPDNILLKPGPLSDDEWVIMRNHPSYAKELIEKIPYLIPCLDIPFCHHERWDGGGYPRQLKGEEIPLPARIFSVIDVYDALLSDRPYRPAWPEEQVIQYLKDQRGHQFDAQIVDRFLQIIHAGLNG